jgi:hypothetical protein
MVHFWNANLERTVTMIRAILLSVCACTFPLCHQAKAEDKVPIEPQPRQEKVALEEPKAPDLAKDLHDLPDGVLKVKTNPNGSFRSLVVKATVEIEDVLGTEKGKRLGRKEAEIQCKRALAQWISESCVFVEGSDKTTTIITKGESSKDAAGNTVKLVGQQGKEVKVLTENHAAMAAACLRGLVVLHSEITDEKKPQYILILGLSQQTMAQAIAVKDALSGKEDTQKPATQPTEGGQPAQPGGDGPAPEQKTSPDAKDFM